MLHGGVSGYPGTPWTCWLVRPLTHTPQPFSRQRGQAVLCPSWGHRESCRGLQPAAGSSCFQALPFTSHLSCQAHAGSSEHCFAGSQGNGESESRRLPQTCSLLPNQACHSFASFIPAMLLRLPAAQQPASLPVAGHRSSQGLWASTMLSRLGLLLLSNGAELAVSIP